MVGGGDPSRRIQSPPLRGIDFEQLSQRTSSSYSADRATHPATAGDDHLDRHGEHHISTIAYASPGRLRARITRSQAHELDQKIQDVYKRIETERKFLEASKLIRQATSNPDVLRKNDAKIREAERSLSYFEDTLRELHSRKLMQQRDDHSRSSSTSSTQPGLPQSPRMARPGEVNRYSGSSSASDYANANRGPRSPELHPSGGPPLDDGHGAPKPKTYTNLDLIKADTPHTTAKISRMLHQLEYKLQVEMQYKRGIDKMAKLYQADGDKKSRADAESKRVESERKIQLLQSALKRYKTLHILDDVEEDDDTGE